MAKSATASALPPGAFYTGRPILEEDLQEVNSNLGYAAAQNPQMLVSMVTGGAGWDGDQEIRTHDIEWPTAGGFQTIFEFYVWVDEDIQGLTVEVTNTLQTSNTGDCRVTVGGTSHTFNVTGTGSPSRQSTTLATSSTGTGLLLVTIELDPTAGTDTPRTFDDFRIQGNTIAAVDLPDPPDE